MKIYWHGNDISIKNEDVEFYENLEKEAFEDILSKGKLTRFRFWKIILTIILLFLWVIPGILFVLYLFSNKHAKGMAVEHATREFYLKKIDVIEMYTSTDGLNIIQNLGSINISGDDEDKIEMEAKIDAYNKYANAIINVQSNVLSHSNTKSYFNGIGAQRGIETETTTEYFLSGDLAIIESNRLNAKCMEESRFNFYGWGKTSIQEFGYLLRMVSQSKYDTIAQDNISAIANDSGMLIKSIDEELARPEPREKVGKETAIANLVNLKNIIISIKKYIDCVNKNN